MKDPQQHLWHKVQKFSPILSHIPFIKMFAICNSLAMGKAHQKSDIDIFIIAQKNRLFTVRILAIILTHILGIRLHGNKIAGRFCLSFFIDETHLNLEKIAIKNDIYLAHWLQTLKPIFAQPQTLKKLTAANQWTEKLTNQALQISTEKLQGPNKSKTLHFLLKGKLGDLLEKILKNWQLKRARKKAQNRPNIIIQPNILKFHENDRRHQYRDNWLKLNAQNS